MKNAIGAVVILFILFLHLLVVPPRNLRGAYYKNFQAANQYRACHYEWKCDTPGNDSYCGEEPDDKDRTTDSCYGACLTYYTEDDSENRLFTGRRCIEYCEDYCLDIEDGTVSCFSCCYDDMCNTSP